MWHGGMGFRKLQSFSLPSQKLLLASPCADRPACRKLLGDPKMISSTRPMGSDLNALRSFSSRMPCQSFLKKLNRSCCKSYHNRGSLWKAHGKKQKW